MKRAGDEKLVGDKWNKNCWLGSPHRRVMYSTYTVISSTEFRKIRILNTTVGVPVKCLECRMGLKQKRLRSWYYKSDPISHHLKLKSHSIPFHSETHNFFWVFGPVFDSFDSLTNPGICPTRYRNCLISSDGIFDDKFDSQDIIAIPVSKPVENPLQMYWHSNWRQNTNKFYEGWDWRRRQYWRLIIDAFLR